MFLCLNYSHLDAFRTHELVPMVSYEFQFLDVTRMPSWTAGWLQRDRFIRQSHTDQFSQ